MKLWHFTSDSAARSVAGTPMRRLSSGPSRKNAAGSASYSSLTRAANLDSKHDAGPFERDRHGLEVSRLGRAPPFFKVLDRRDADRCQIGKIALPPFQKLSGCAALGRRHGAVEVCGSRQLGASPFRYRGL